MSEEEYIALAANKFMDDYLEGESYHIVLNVALSIFAHTINDADADINEAITLLKEAYEFLQEGGADEDNY